MKILRFTIVPLAAWIILAASFPVNAEPYLYIGYRDQNQVGVIDTATDTVVGTISGFTGTQDLAVRPDGRFVYVADGDDLLRVVDALDNTIVDTLTVGEDPYGIAAHPDNTRVYVGNNLMDTVSVIDTTTHTVLTEVSVGPTPSSLVVLPDGSLLYTANFNGPSLSVIETVNNTVTTTIDLPDSPFGIAAHPNSSRVYVSDTNNSALWVIDTSSQTVIDTIAVGNQPEAIAVSPEGDYLYVVNELDDNISVVDLATNLEVDTIESVGDAPYGLAVHPDGSRLYSVNIGDDSIGVVDVLQRVLLDQISQPAVEAFQEFIGPDFLAQLDRDAVTFADQEVGTQSTEQTVVLSFTGLGPMAVISIQTTGDFSQSNDCPGALDFGTTCRISLSFAPSVAGPLSGLLRIETGANNGTLEIPLTGTGIAVPPTNNNVLGGGGCAMQPHTSKDSWPLLLFLFLGGVWTWRTMMKDSR